MSLHEISQYNLLSRTHLTYSKCRKTWRIVRRPNFRGAPYVQNNFDKFFDVM